MTLKYQLAEKDFLEQLLFATSTSERAKSRKRKTCFWITVAFASLAFVFFQSGNTFLMYYFILCSVATLLFYPAYYKNQFRKSHKNFVTETYNNRLNELCTIVFTDAGFETFDVLGESKINYAAIKEIIEVKAHFFVNMKTGECLIIPKSKIEDAGGTKTYLEALAQRLGVQYKEMLEWKW